VTTRIGVPADSTGRSLWTLGDDNAINTLDEDEFGRAAFARHLAQVIDSSPPDSSFRIGLFGEWGEGKTSVMGMMRNALHDMGHVSVRISTWATEEPADILRQIAGALASETGVSNGVRNAANIAGRAGSLKELRQMASDGPWWLQSFNLVFGRAAGQLLDEQAQQATRGLMKRALEALDERRAVIMVDDLDRTKPEALPQILMALREVVNMPGVYCVLGLSAAAVADGLRKSGYGLEDPERFLEKIIEYPAYLPAIPREALERYARTRVEQIDGLRRPDVLQELAPLLPQNPRRLKLFLRSVAALRRTLDRFDDDEVNWVELYLAQLLLVEFPTEARRLREDRDVTAAMDLSWASAASPGLQSNRDGNHEPPESKYAPAENGERRERFLRLCACLREQQSLSSRYRLAELLRLEAAPPYTTRREARAHLTSLEQLDRSDWAGLIHSKLSAAPLAAPDVALTLWTFVLERLSERLRESVQSLQWDERVNANEGATRMCALLDCWVHDIGAFRLGVLSASAWMEWFNSVSVWCSASEERGESGAHASDLVALEHALEGAPVPMIEAVYKSLSRELERGLLVDRTVAFRAWIQKVQYRLACQVMENVFQRFERPDGLGVYYYCEWHQHGKAVLFDIDSPIYDATGLQRLDQLAARAAGGDRIITDNFLTLVRLLSAGSSGRVSGISSEAVKALMSKPELMRATWQAATGTPLTDNAASMLHGVRVQVLKLGGVSPDDLPIPLWWSKSLKLAAADDEAARTNTGRDG
jgi:hypothetical protein